MNNNKNNNSKDRLCKKCGGPIAQKSKHKLCVKCRDENAKNWRSVGKGVVALGSLALSFIPVVKHFRKK